MRAIALIAGALLAAQALAGPQVDKEFTSMDTDHDSKVSAVEHAAGAKMMFGKMDANHDGKVTAAEMTAAHQAVTGQRARNSDMPAADKIKAVDSDGDGILTAVEHANASASMFAKMDSDKDGLLNKQEMAAGHAAMLKK